MAAIRSFVRREPVLLIAALAALLSCFLVPPDAAYLNYLDWRTLALLYCLMTVVAGLRQAGLFAHLAHTLCEKAGSVRAIGLLLVLLSFFAAMLITNDVALLTFVPFAVVVLGMADRTQDLIRIVVLQTVAANLGSMLTPVGNPQNLYLYSYYNYGFLPFLRVTLPYWLLSLGLIAAACLLLPKERLHLFLGEAPGIDRKGLGVYAALFALCLLVVLHVLPWPVMLAGMVLVLAVYDRKTLTEADFLLLLTFFLPNIFRSEPLMIVPAAVYIVSIICSKKKGSLLITLFIYSAVICYLIYCERYYIHRVEWSIMFTVLVSILYLFEPVEKIVRQGTIKLVFMTFVCVMTVAGIFVTCFIPVKDHLQSVSDRANRHKASVDLLNDHEGYRYMIHTLAVVTDDRRTVFSIPHTDALSDAFLMGGWSYSMPKSEVGDFCQIEGNPWTTCVDSDDIRVVMNNNDMGEYCIKVMEYYIEEQYGLEVTHVLEDSNEHVLIYAIVSEDSAE